MEVKLSLRDKQIDQIRTMLIKYPEPFWKTESFFRAVQSIAIFLGGCRVLINFLVSEQGRARLELLRLRQ